MYPDAVNHDNYQSQIHYGESDLPYHQHQSLVEGFEPLEENLESIDNQPDDLPSGEIKYSDDVALDGEENLEDNEGEIVLSNFHKTIDNSGNTWNYGDQYPVSDFRCSNKIYAGYYADVQSDCQIWHLCEPNGRHHSFSCPNGTLFNQLYRVCDWWYNVDCPKSREYYHINRDQGLINHNNKDYRNQQPNDYSQSFNDQNGNNQLPLGSKTPDSDDY
ncbi:uncharacterized protein LOC107368238 [Tetranychus urticae]|uniref:Chitin-binding type-2 domain-containing protein n=1 Tax=Tetranychus urticae TaxID=32264 RepID=T1KXT1_TETUR|nr:uncharacterized protein LOC107368238 [Tetranychus urticae]